MRNKYVVRVDPQGQTMVVDILDMAGVSVPAYESPQFAATARALPLTITSQTDFCLAAPGAYDVSCKVGGSEVADAGAPKRVRLTDVPVLVTPDWERQRTAASAASSAVGKPCWFQLGETAPTMAAGATYTPLLSVNTDGVAAGTDVIIHAADNAAVEVVTPGLYILSSQVQMLRATGETAPFVTVSAYISLNADAQGPAYYQESDADLTTTSALNGATLHPAAGLPLILATGDLIKVLCRTFNNVDPITIENVSLVLVKVADPPV